MRQEQRSLGYPKALNLNLGKLIFIIILVYILFAFVSYFRSKHIVVYEVKDGSLSADDTYKGIAIRQEKIEKSADSGYVNYFASEGGRVAVGNLVYTIDENGGLMDLLKSEGSDTVTLSAQDMGELRTQIMNFCSDFRDTDFSKVYDFKTGLQGTAQKFANTSILSNIEALSKNADASAIHYYDATETGTVVYYTDGYETKRPEQLDRESFEDNQYKKKPLVNNNLIAEGDPVYKIITDENWSVALSVDEKMAKSLTELGFVKVRFLKNQDELWASVSETRGSDQKPLILLSFTNSMMTFCTDRFLDVQLITEERRGLKIPKSAIVKKNFYVIPKEYLTKGENGVQGVLKKGWSKNGRESVEFKRVTVYNETESSYDIGDASLSAGDILQKPESTDTLTLKNTEKLTGVYNINKGYADFRQIRILYQNEEYAIVEPNTMYGLSEFDYIALDSSTVKDDDLIYE